MVQAGGSDTATLDNVFELLVRGGRDAPMAKAMLIPREHRQQRDDAGGASRLLPLLQRGDGALGRAGGDRGTDGRWVIAGLDRNGLRPLRYTQSPPTDC